MNNVFHFLRRTVVFDVTRNLKFNLFETKVSSNFFCVTLWIVLVGNLRKLTFFPKRAPTLVFWSPIYKAFFCPSDSPPICYTITFQQIVLLSKFSNGFLESCLNNLKLSLKKMSFFSLVPNCQQVIRNETGYT